VVKGKKEVRIEEITGVEIIVVAVEDRVALAPVPEETTGDNSC
jgi:hypothetical protein